MASEDGTGSAGGTAEQLAWLHAALRRVIVGADDAIRLLIIALAAGGHALLEDVPGVGKTTLARTLARSLGGTFQRIQCTPDVLPTDITGTSIFNQRTAEFELRRGPLFANIVLADEINRAGPRTQSALLEAMAEHHVTIDGQTLPLPAPFLVVATQNPIELEGTFPLPEAQLDRFLVSFELGYPTLDEERVLIRRYRTDEPGDDVVPVLSTEDVLALQQACRSIRIDPSLEDYALSLVRRSRESDLLQLGVSPRGTLSLLRAAQGHALLRGGTYLLPDDVKAVAVPALAHRVMVRSQARLRGRTRQQVIQELLDAEPVPGGGG